MSSTRQHYDVTRFRYVLWRRTMHEWVMNIHYQTWIAQGRFINMIRTPSKQWGVCDKYIYIYKTIVEKSNFKCHHCVWHCNTEAVKRSTICRLQSIILFTTAQEASAVKSYHAVLSCRLVLVISSWEKDCDQRLNDSIGCIKDCTYHKLASFCKVQVSFSV